MKCHFNNTRPTKIPSAALAKIPEVIIANLFSRDKDRRNLPTILSYSLLVMSYLKTLLLTNGHDRTKGEELSWPLYEELEKYELKDASNHMQVDKNTVSRRKLHAALMAAGHFSEGQANQIIDEMIKAGKLEEVIIGTLRRANKDKK